MTDFQISADSLLFFRNAANGTGSNIFLLFYFFYQLQNFPGRCFHQASSIIPSWTLVLLHSKHGFPKQVASPASFTGATFRKYYCSIELKQP